MGRKVRAKTQRRKVRQRFLCAIAPLPDGQAGLREFLEKTYYFLRDRSY